MKKNLFIICVPLFSAFPCFSQSADQTAYRQKSKTQKIAAWSLLGGGVVVSVIGLSQINLAGSDQPVNNTPGTVLFFTGIAASLSSIPLFIASKRNKKSALALSFKTEKTQLLIKNNYINIPVTSLTIKVFPGYRRDNGKMNITGRFKGRFSGQPAIAF